ncbi:MAG: type II toxin-antitoxin system RelE/ParE family toxin [Proteobacteria bacterium]|nr:type II toxin-antitoxin system RelE/ParE family toxin [Pseudomonadota bacterium]
MKVVFTAAALTDLEDIIAYTKQNFPCSAVSLQRRIRDVVSRIEMWPHSGRSVAERPGVHVVPLIRYPFRIFYTLSGDEIHILHIHHAARADEE